MENTVENKVIIEGILSDENEIKQGFRKLSFYQNSANFILIENNAVLDIGVTTAYTGKIGKLNEIIIDIEKKYIDNSENEKPLSEFLQNWMTFKTNTLSTTKNTVAFKAKFG